MRCGLPNLFGVFKTYLTKHAVFQVDSLEDGVDCGHEGVPWPKTSHSMLQSPASGVASGLVCLGGRQQGGGRHNVARIRAVHHHLKPGDSLSTGRCV